MCLKMSGTQGKRGKQLSKDTASAIHHTSMALAELKKHLLTEEGFDYVCLAEFSNDRLEKAFGQLRQGSRGTYFISAQQVENLRIIKTKLLLSLNVEVEAFEA